MDLEKLARSGATSGAGEYDLGLRQYMLKIYNYMALALALTGFVAYLVSSSPELMRTIFGTPLMYVAIFAPLAVVIYLSVRINKLTLAAAQAWFWIYSFLMGVSMASIFMMYTGASIARCFFITASVFGGMSLFGYTTRRDLTSMGSFLIMGVWGLLIASVVNLFMNSSGLDFAVSLLSVVIFTGLVAYDTQKLKNIYDQVSGADREKMAVFGALNLYIDFINIMVSLLRFFGDRR